MERMGYRGVAHDLISSYFSNRKQFTYVNGVSSPIVDSNSGTPQGSNFGPTCFALYLNDIFSLFDDLVSVVGYADDCAIIINGNDIEKLVLKMNQTLDKLSDWCNYNRLAINISKTKYMFITNKVVGDYPICIRNENLERVFKFNYLGVTLTSKLKYTEHVRSLENKLAQLNAVVKRKK